MYHLFSGRENAKGSLMFSSNSFLKKYALNKTPFKNMQKELEKNTESYTWRPLRILNIYRIFIALSLSALFLLLDRNQSLNANHPDLFFITGYGYLTFAFLSAIAVIRKLLRFRIQLLTQTIVDIAAFTLLIFAKDPTDGTLGVLLIISVAGNSMLMSRRLTVAIASFASLGLLGQQTYAIWQGNSTVEAYTFIAVICIATYIMAIAANTISRHAKEFEALAKKRGIDLDSLEQVNEHIVNRMQFGVIALDNEYHVKLINNAAENILGISGIVTSTHINKASPELHRQLNLWQETKLTSRIPFETPKTSALARFVALGEQGNQGVLVFIEDESEVTQRIQDAKLASLGQLTASIAHEIRNPLGAISHAGQLLAESEILSAEDKRLTEIIANHSERLNVIIKSILHLSKKQKPVAGSIDLEQWMEKFIYELSIEQHINISEVRFTNEQKNITTISMDPAHLEQVMWNLCKNALFHNNSPSSPKVMITFKLIDSSPALEITNKGDKISNDIHEKLFEPFYTTSNQGTGLGLFLSKELCTNNGVRLNHIADHSDGTCFRLTFPSIYNTAG